MHAFSAQVARKRLSLTASVAADAPQWLNGDPGRLRQILVNLLSNAIKFTDAGSVRVAVTREARGADASWLHFVVEDTGPGIPADRLDSIFEAFSQVDSSITRRFGGTGLGLAICSDLVRLMGGRIWVESQPGRGSAFHFAAAFAQSSGPADHGPGTGAPLLDAGLRILIAEDNPVNQKVLGQMLAACGHSFEVAEDGEDAIQRLCEGSFDAVLMDVQMPRLDGLEATRRIRAMNGALADVPVIGVTAGATPPELLACREAGMSSYITKPLTMRAIQEALALVRTRPSPERGEARPATAEGRPGL
jgi:CheY-like chemotaxis protein/anti-sigma regulatory factor (Ser/Thr protein kinase)